MDTINLALDWTPNVNHIGFFVAEELGFYKKNDLKVNIINPQDDNYETTPCKKLELGQTDFAIAPFESVISYNNKSKKFDAMAVFAILQEDISSIACLKSSNINRPQQLDDKIYASYKARYEDFIVKKMIENDGGKVDIKITYPDKLGIWNTLLEQKADATWIFNNWEGVEAETQNIDLNLFSLKDYDIPYGYSPVVVTKKKNIETHRNNYSKFIKATQQGFLHTVNQPAEAEKILLKYVPEQDKKRINISKTIKYTLPYLVKSGQCGMMDKKRVDDFLNWLVNNNLEDEVILNQDLFTNELLG